MLYNVLNTLLLIGSIQGFIFTFIVLSSQKRKSKSNLFLTALIVGFSFNNLQYYLLNTELISPSTFFGFWYIPYASINMVFLFFYVKFLLNPNSKVKPFQYVLFLPFVLFFFASTYYKIGGYFGEFSENTLIFFSNLLAFHEFFSGLFSLIILISVLAMITAYEKQNKDSCLPTSFRWLKILSRIALILCGFWMYASIQEFLFNMITPHYYILWVGISFIIYILGHVGLNEFEANKIQLIKKKHKNLAKNAKNPTHNKHIAEFENFVKIEKNYLNPQLSLELIADHLHINKSYLSRIINSEMEVSFSDYINRLRVEEAETYLTLPEYKDYTLSTIGLEAGFNSKSVFNTCFKKYTGFTPSEYRKKQTHPKKSKKKRNR